MISPKDEFKDGALELKSKRNYCFTNCIDDVFPKFAYNNKITLLRDSFVTIAAPIGFLPAVPPQVSLKIDILFKALSHRLD